MKVKNIIIVSDYGFIEGGASQVAISTSINLAELGYNVTLFCAVPPEVQVSKLKNYNIISTNQPDIQGDSNRLRAIFNGIWNFKSLNKLAEMLDKYERDDTIVHVHTWTKAVSSSVAYIALKKKFKIVFTLHDYFTVCPNGAFFNFPKNVACNLKPLSINCLITNCDRRSYLQKVWRSMRQFAQRHLGRVPIGIDNFIVLSDFSEAILKKYLPENANIFRCNNPVAVNKQPPVDVKNNTTFLYVGRLSEEKGPLLLAEAAEKIKCKIVFVGSGPCEVRIKEICPSAIITGWLDRDQIIAQLKEARVLVFPSLLYEVQPLSVLEAAALGVPAIVPSPSSACDLVTNKKTGLLFKAGELNDLSEMMLKFNEPSLASSLGISSYNNFWKHPPTMDDHINELVYVYNQIMKN